MLTVSDEDWLRVFSVNPHSCFYLSKAALPCIMEPRTGSIIAIGAAWHRSRNVPLRRSNGGQDRPLGGPSCAVAAEFAPYNIRANMVNPGSIDTTRRNPEWAPRIPNMRQPTPEALQAIPLGRLGTVHEIAGACLFLASDDSSYVTGDQLNGVGGKYMVAAQGQ